MFGKKLPEKLKQEEPQVDVISMPADFYGGVNPVVQYKDVTKTITREKTDITPSEKKMLDHQTKAGGDSKFHPVNLLSNKNNLIIGAVGIFIVAILGGSVYYFIQYKKAQQANTVPVTPTSTEVVAPLVETPTTTETVEVAPVEPENIPPIRSASENLKLPSQFLYDSKDMDNDKVSDVAEDVFGTDPGNADTDKDVYPDGHEINYLYNPNGFAPKKIIDADIVRDYENQLLFYRVYYPNDWALGEVDTAKRDVLFSTISGENIEISVFDLALGETFSDWFSKNLPQEKYSDLSPFLSVFKVDGLMRKDGLVYYFYDQNRVYIMYYNPAISTTINYRIVLTMMARSFRLPNSSNEVPTQLIEENSAPTTSPINNPSSAPL